MDLKSGGPKSLLAVIAPTACRRSWASGLQPTALLLLLYCFRASICTLALVGE